MGSCREIKESEGKDAVSKNYWLDLSGSGKAALVYRDDCDVNAGSYCTNAISSFTCTSKQRCLDVLLSLCVRSGYQSSQSNQLDNQTWFDATLV